MAVNGIRTCWARNTAWTLNDEASIAGASTIDGACVGWAHQLALACRGIQRETSGALAAGAYNDETSITEALIVGSRPGRVWWADWTTLTIVESGPRWAWLAASTLVHEARITCTGTILPNLVGSTDWDTARTLEWSSSWAGLADSTNVCKAWIADTRTVKPIFVSSADADAGRPLDGGSCWAALAHSANIGESLVADTHSILPVLISPTDTDTGGALNGSSWWAALAHSTDVHKTGVTDAESNSIRPARVTEANAHTWSTLESGASWAGLADPADVEEAGVAGAGVPLPARVGWAWHANVSSEDAAGWAEGAVLRRQPRNQDHNVGHGIDVWGWASRPVTEGKVRIQGDADAKCAPDAKTGNSKQVLTESQPAINIEVGSPSSGSDVPGRRTVNDNQRVGWNLVVDEVADANTVNPVRRVLRDVHEQGSAISRGVPQGDGVISLRANVDLESIQEGADDGWGRPAGLQQRHSASVASSCAVGQGATVCITN